MNGAGRVEESPRAPAEMHGVAEREFLNREFVEGIPYKADPSPCPRCGHREDVHEPFGAGRYCRHCEWIGAVYPCSRRTIGAQQKLDSLSFDLEP